MSVLTTDQYLPGVFVLHESLLQTRTAYPFHVAMTPQLLKATREKLEKQLIPTLAVSTIVPPLPQISHGNHAHWRHTFTKLAIFNMTSFAKIVYLDSDLLIVANIDALFREPHMAAVRSGAVLKPWYKHLNSGVLVVEPATDQFLLVMGAWERLKHSSSSGKGNSSMRGDQDVLNLFMPQWHRHKGLSLDPTYNTFLLEVPKLTSLHYKLPLEGVIQSHQPIDRHTIRVIHFTADVPKPWQDHRWNPVSISGRNQSHFAPLVTLLYASWQRVYLQAIERTHIGGHQHCPECLWHRGQLSVSSTQEQKLT